MPNLISFKTTNLHFGSLVDSGFDKILNENYRDSQFVILIDETVSAHWSEFLITKFEALAEAEIIEIQAGEENKSIEICSSVWEALSEYEINRNDVIINVGGGMVSDLGGFVASTFKRGIRFINIPTTLLAQVDASVGGKTGVDLGPLKNQIGVFSEPDFVFIDSGFLETLPNDQILSGFSEMLKHGLIADQLYWRNLITLNPTNHAEIFPSIFQSVELKKSIVEQDYEEKGVRKILNFGHTIGHAIEGSYLQKRSPILHGHAVAFGMIAESYISWKMELISEQEFKEIEGVLRGYYGKYLTEKLEASVLLKLMRNDKKNSAVQISFSLLDGIGKCVYDQKVDRDLIAAAIDYL